MPVQDGEYVKLSKEDIEERLKADLQEELGVSAEPGELVEKQLSAEAKTLAENQEEALERVHQAAYLADAAGKELDKVVEIIGLERRESSSSTGTVKLWRETPPSFDYTVPKGEEVQTGGTDSIRYEVTQLGALRLIENFDAGTLDSWAGNVSAFDVIDGELKVPTETNKTITTKTEDYKIGTTFCFNLNCDAGATFAFRFGQQDGSNYYECEIDQGSQDLTLRSVTEGTEDTISTNGSANIPSTESYVEVTWGLYNDHTVEIYETEERDNLLSSTSLSGATGWTTGTLSLSSVEGDSVSLVDDIATRAIHLNVESISSGPQTNVGPNTISEFVGNLDGIEEVTNPVATGNPEEINTNGVPFVTGEDREDDEALRERAYNSNSIGGAATVSAIGSVLEELDGVRSVNLNRNREGGTVDGLPPHSFEAVVYGGEDRDIGRAIFETASIDSHDVGGINGTEASYVITSQVTNEEEEINWSRPNRLNLEITLDLVVDENYVGENKIRSIVANHIGGTGLDGSFITGLTIGKDIYQAVLFREIVKPEETGVWEVDDVTIDKSGDGTNDITTTASGAEVLPVGANEVAVANARDGSITINTTQK